METLESLRRKLHGAKDLKSVVRTMKIVAALNIGQYEKAVRSLDDYSRTLALGMHVCLANKIERHGNITDDRRKNMPVMTYALVFGSDQGLVGQFNDALSDFVCKTLAREPGTKHVWAVGERIESLLTDAGYHDVPVYEVPGSVKDISPFVNQVLLKCEQTQRDETQSHVLVFHNKQANGSSFTPSCTRLLPLDKAWAKTFAQQTWPTKNIPQVAGNHRQTLEALVHSYLFTLLFQASAESLASENACRLAAMQRAEKNIDELLDDLKLAFHSLRQSNIDAELFDVISGFEAMT